MALKEFSGELDQPIQQKLIPFTGALDSEIPTAPKRPEIKSIGSGLIDAAKQVGQVIFGDAPSMNDGRALHSLPPEPAKFDFASASRVQRKLDDAREQRKTHGTIGPIVGPAASAGSIARGLATDVATGAQRANAGVDQMLGDLTGLRPYLDAAKRGYAQADLTGAMHTPQFESETAAGIYSGLSSMARQAIPMAASIATRNPGIVLAGMTVPMVPEKYGEYRLRGETPVMSLLGAGSQAGVEYLTEKMPMTFLVNKMGRAGAGQFLTGLLAREVPGEQVATLVQDAIDTAVANPTMTWGEYVASRPSAAYQTLLATLTQGGIMGGVNAGMDRMARQPAQPTAEGMLKLHGWNPAQPLAPVQQPAQQPPAPKMRRAPDNIKLDPVTLPQQDGMPTLEQLVQALQPGATVADDMRAMQPRPPVSVGQKPAGKAPDNVTRFTHSVRPAAERVAQQLRAPVEAVIGQWGLETGWGRSIIPGTNNLGNIKDFSGKGVAATDNITGSRDKYRAYSNVDEFAGDFSNLIGRGRYRAVPGSQNAAAYFGALKAAGYAEDPGYVGKGVKAAQMAAAALGKPFDPGHAMQFGAGGQFVPSQPAGMSNGPVPMYGATQDQQGVEIRPSLPDDPRAPDAGPQPVDPQTADSSDMFAAVLQNRDRSTPGSIAQMQSIAANPDYGRMGYSRDFANGAPVVAGGQIAPDQLGRQDMAVASDGRRIPVQYAVVEAGEVITSNEVDGTSNASYADRNVPGIRAIAGNGRIAGVRAAYGAGRAGAYTQELASDSLHGIDPGVIQRMQNPVLVRVMPQEAVTRDIGDVSNTVGNLSMTAVEQARNDASRVDLPALQFAADGSITPETVRGFVRSMPTSEQGGLLDSNGQPTRQAVDRVNAAVFAKAYGNDGLVRLYAQAQDPEARLILSALAQAAPSMARLEGARDLDIRDLVTQAAEVAVNARRDGRTIKQAAEQLDLATDQGVLAVLDLFAANPRSAKPVAEALQRAAQFAYTEANKDGTDMFGEVPRSTRQDVLAQLNEGGQNGTVTEGQADLGQPAGRQPDAGNAGYQTDDRARPADAGATEAGRPTAGTESAAEPAGAESEGLTSYTPDEIVQRQDEAQRQQEQQQRDDREAEQRARADAEVGEFTLTGSDRAADANPNQGTMFSESQPDIIGTPVNDIRAAIRKAYGNILAGLERGGKVALTQTEQDAIDAAAQARADARGTSVEAERAKLMQSMQASRSLPDGKIDIKRSDNGAIQGFYDPATGKSFLIADNLSAEAAPAVLLHEVGIHLSNDGTLDPLFARAKQLVDGVKGNPFIDRVRERIKSAGETSAEEAAAYMAEEFERDRLGAPNTVRQWIERFIADVRAWLHRHGVMSAGRLQPADIAAIARANLRQAAKGAPVEGNAPKFSRAKAKELRNLVTLHNMSEENLLHADAMGGMPVPSLGITKVDAPFSGFGGITLIGNKGMVDPQAGVPVYDSDAWTARYPEMNFKRPKRAKADAFLNSLRAMTADIDVDDRGLGSRVWDAMVNDSVTSPDKIADLMIRSDAMRIAYLRDVLGKPFNVPMTATPAQYSFTRDKALLAYFKKNGAGSAQGFSDAVRGAIDRWLESKAAVSERSAVRLRDLYSGIFDDAGLLRQREMDRIVRDLQSAGTKQVDGVALARRLNNAVPTDDRGFLNWVTSQVKPLFEPPTMTLRGKQVEPTLDNIVAAMTTGATVGAEKSMTFGAGKVSASLGKRFKSLDEIKAARDQVVSEEQEKAAKKSADEALTAYRQHALEFFTGKDWRGDIDTWAGMDAAMEALAIGGKATNDDGIRSALQRKGFKGFDVRTVELARDAIDAVRNTQTNYFEAKPQRAVKLAEFAGAVVPRGISQEALDVLEKNGLAVETYSKADGAREKAIEKMAKRLDKQQGDVLFSRSQQSAQGQTAAQQQAGLPNISQQQPPANNPPPPHQQMRYNLTGGGAAWSVDAAVDSWLENAIRNYQNNKIDLKRVVDAVAATGKRIADDANPYLADELYIGRVTDALEQMTERQVKPLLKAISDAGVKPAELEQYLHARHAEERNRQMAKVNNDPFDLDYNMAGMSTREARAIIQRVHAGDKAAEMQRLATMVYALTRATRVRLVQNGLATIDEINAWEGAYKQYVPLMRDVEESGGKAQGYNVKGNESRRAVGSTAEAKNILANVIAQAESSIIRSEKARVGRAMLQFAKDNPNPDFWTVNTPPTERAIDDGTGLVVNRVVPNFMNRENVLVVKVNGKEQYITFNEKNQRAMSLVRNLRNMEVAEIGPVVEAFGKVNRYMATWITSRNPFFWIRNFARDVQGVVFNLQNTPIRGKEAAIMASLPKAFAATAASEFGNGGNGLMARYLRDFEADGGKTGFMRGYDDSLDRMREIEKQIRQMGQSAADPRRVGRALLDAIDGANDVVENMVRLAVYAQARQQGVSRDQAASIAKNITVNFNRKGNRTAVVNSLYMFANAGVQGNVRMLNAVTLSRRAQVYAGALTGVGAMLTTLNWFMSGDDDETRKRRYQLVPEWERERNWIIFKPNSDEYYKVPLPIGPHIFFNAGRVMAEAVLDKDAKPLDLAASFFASTLASLNPVGGGMPSKDVTGAMQMLTPSAARPIVDLAVNQSFTGAPISKAPSPYSKHQPPAYQRTRDKTPGYWKDGAELLNDWSGGDDVTPGAANITPEALAYLIKGYVVPGIASAADKFGRAATADELKLKIIPGADAFFGEIDEAARNRAAWDRADLDGQKAGEAMAYLETKRPELARQRFAEMGDGDPDLGRKRASMMKRRDEQMRQINRSRSEVRKMPDGEAKKRAMDNMDKAAARINAAYVRGTGLTVNEDR